MGSFLLRGRQLAKSFGNQRLFQGIDFDLLTGDQIAIIGPNGSGKSTLLRILAGAMAPDSGSIEWEIGGKRIPPSDIHRHIAYAAPYLSPPEELSLSELLRFHSKFKTPSPHLDLLVKSSGLHPHRSKTIKQYSSGMMQRVRLILAFGFTEPLLLLDEPGTNLDSTGAAWYADCFQNHSGGKVVILASNIPSEYAGMNYCAITETLP